MDISKLKGTIPDTVIDQIPNTMSTFNINTPLRLSHFLAQCAHESGGFKLIYENLNYSADGLKKIFPKYFPGMLNESYARKPELIASHVYAGRMGNGPEATKDGWSYRGRGYIQLTGKSNYAEFDKVVSEDILNNPNMVATKYPLLSAAWFWNRNSLNSIADRGYTTNVVTQITKRVNGGVIGINDRINHFNKFYALLK